MAEMESNVSWKKQILHLLFWLFVCFAVAGTGSWATSSSVNTWYQQLERPSWNPPNWIFPVVWTTLFAMMALAASRVSARCGWDRSLTWFLIHLGANLLWSFLFFYFQQIHWAAVEIFVLLGLIGWTAWLFGRRDFWAGVLMVPYFLWVSFASFLNLTIASLN